MNYNLLKSGSNKGGKRRVSPELEARRIAEVSGEFEKYLLGRGYRENTAHDYARTLMHDQIRPFMQKNYGCDSIYWLKSERELRMMLENIHGLSDSMIGRVRNATMRYIEFLSECTMTHDEAVSPEYEMIKSIKVDFEAYMIARGMNECAAKEYANNLNSRRIEDTMMKTFGVATVYAITDIDKLRGVSVMFAGTQIDRNKRFRASVNKYMDFLKDKLGAYEQETAKEGKNLEIKNEPLTAEEELMRLDAICQHAYCIGDIDNAHDKPAKILSIRPNMLQVTDQERTDVGSRDINDILKSLCKLLHDGPTMVSTTPALAMMYGVVEMEFDYALVRLNMDKRFLSEGLVMTFGEKGWRVDYKAWAEKLSEAKAKWGYKQFKETDNACYADPNFEFDSFGENHKRLWDLLQTKLDAAIMLLKKMHQYITKPNKEKIINIYYMLEAQYMQHYFPQDKEDFEEFILGVPRCNVNTEIDGYHMTLEAKLNGSGFFDWFGKDPVTARHMLFNGDTMEWDKESIARYIFGNRKRMTQDMVTSFFCYMKMTEHIKKELIEETPKAKAPTAIAVEHHTIAPQMPEAVAKLLSNVSPSTPINITVNYVSGDQVAKKDANIDKNFGTIISGE